MRNFIILFCLLILNSCGLSGSALLGPIYTGATTGSAYQTSISFGSGKLFKEISADVIDNKAREKESLNQSSVQKIENLILVTMVVDKVEISEVIDPEPLP